MTGPLASAKPIESIVPDNSELQEILRLPDKAMATSGNYRNFYVENGKKICPHH